MKSHHNFPYVFICTLQCAQRIAQNAFLSRVQFYLGSPLLSVQVICAWQKIQTFRRSATKQSKLRSITPNLLRNPKLRTIGSGESRIIFLPERSSICQYPSKISAINVNKQSRAGLLLAHPVLYILKIQKTYGTF